MSEPICAICGDIFEDEDPVTDDTGHSCHADCLYDDEIEVLP
jgi:hypothetical protein